MKKYKHSSPIFTLWVLGLCFFGATLNSERVNADELVSLDDPAPAVTPAPGSPVAPRVAPATGAPLTGTSVAPNNSALAPTTREELESLDGSAASAGPAIPSTSSGNLESLDGTAAAPASGDAEVSLDLGSTGSASGEAFFNPYTFSRDRAWVLLPLFSLLLLGLHLMPVPKRKSKSKIDQSQRFLKPISGESTSIGIERMKLMAEQSKMKGDE